MRSKKTSSRKQLPANESKVLQEKVTWGISNRKLASTLEISLSRKPGRGGGGVWGQKVGHLALEKEGLPWRDNVEETWRHTQHKGSRKELIEKRPESPSRLEAGGSPPQSGLRYRRP